MVEYKGYTLEVNPDKLVEYLKEEDEKRPEMMRTHCYEQLDKVYDMVIYTFEQLQKDKYFIRIIPFETVIRGALSCVHGWQKLKGNYYYVVKVTDRKNGKIMYYVCDVCVDKNYDSFKKWKASIDVGHDDVDIEQIYRTNDRIKAYEKKAELIGRDKTYLSEFGYNSLKEYMSV